MWRSMVGDSLFSPNFERGMNNFLRGNLILDRVTSKKPTLYFYLISIKGSHKNTGFFFELFITLWRPHNELKKMCWKPGQVLNTHVNRDSYYLRIGTS